MKHSHIHWVGDGRGRRQVFVNGNLVNDVIYADTVKGIVTFTPHPLRLHKRKRDEVYTRKLRGSVEVLSMEDVT